MNTKKANVTILKREKMKFKAKNIKQDKNDIAKTPNHTENQNVLKFLFTNTANSNDFQL